MTPHNPTPPEDVMRKLIEEYFRQSSQKGK